MNRKLTSILAGSASILIIGTTSANAAVTVTDNGLTVPTIGADDTGYTGTTNQRFGWDTGEGFTQSFTVPTAGTIGSIYLGYNAFDNGDTITLDLSVNGSFVQTVVLDGDNFSGIASGPGADGNGGENYWMEFDLSGENVAVVTGAAANSFTLLATANTGDSWAFAPRLNQNGNPYSGGGLSQPTGSTYNPPTNSDMAFVVTVVPEPSTALLGGLGFLVLLRRRR